MKITDIIAKINVSILCAVNFFLVSCLYLHSLFCFRRFWVKNYLVIEFSTCTIPSFRLLYSIVFLKLTDDVFISVLNFHSFQLFFLLYYEVCIVLDYIFRNSLLNSGMSTVSILFCFAFILVVVPVNDLLHNKLRFVI